MTVPRVSPGDPDPIGAVAEGGQNKFRVHPGRARDPYDPDIGRVLEAAYAREIGRTITAPVTEKRCNFWFQVIHFLASLQPAFNRGMVTNIRLDSRLIDHGHNLSRLESA